MNAGLNREEAVKVLKMYNKETFHLIHGLTVEAVMKWYAKHLGYEDEVEFWGIAGLLHDVDYEMYPQEHCKKAVELLENSHARKELIHAVCSHGYQICSEIRPEHEMEKVLYTIDELTGLIGAAARMRPSKSCSDMKVSSLKKKFKDKSFASGCSREVIRKGAEMLGWELDVLFEQTIEAMRCCEEKIKTEMAAM